MKQFFKRILALSAALAALTALAAPQAVAETINPAKDLTSLSGAPIDKDGKQYAAADATVTPGQTVYFLLPGSAGKILGNERNIRLSVRKNRNSKYINRIYLTERYLPPKTYKDDYIVPSGITNNNYYTTNAVKAYARHQYVAVEIKDYTGSEEIRLDFDLNFTVRRDSTTGYGFTYGTGRTDRVANPKDPKAAAWIDNPAFIENSKFRETGDRLTLSGRIYVGNKQTNGYDTSVTVGGAGKTIKIAASDSNFVSFDTKYNTIATLEFTGSSNPEDFIARLSTKWTSGLLSKFRNTDAVIWRFTPANIDCDSRAKLTLTNPFDEDQDPNRVYIYTVNSNGVLQDVTSKFTYDDEEDVYYTRTRSLGTYIISDKRVNIKK